MDMYKGLVPNLYFWFFSKYTICNTCWINLIKIIVTIILPQCMGGLKLKIGFTW